MTQYGPSAHGNAAVRPEEQVRLLAIYLPQFHPIPENDEWWGKGFTEWRNVAKGKPLFRGHYQPHVPSDLGFYDLRLAEAREAQAQLARDYGVHGFCYFHYWFKGRRILERPFNEVLASGKPEFPFCLLWANQTWEGRWHGITKENKVLIRQEYSEEDDLNHIRWLAEAMDDSRYVRVANRPVFTILYPLELPNPRKTLDIWKNEMSRLGMPEPYVIAADSEAPGRNFTELGFDGVLQYLPELGVLECSREITLRYRVKRLILNLLRGVVSTDLHVFDYEHAVKLMLPEPNFPVFRSIIPAWDNSPRSGKRGVILRNSDANKFEKFLTELYSKTQNQLPPGHRILFINAWNEWAEGNHLEPDLQNGLQYLEAIKRVGSGYESFGSVVIPTDRVELQRGDYPVVGLSKRLYWQAREQLRRLREI